MGGGAGPAGQVLAGPLFTSLIIHKMIGISLGLTCFLEITTIFSLCLVKQSSHASNLARALVADYDDVIVMNKIKFENFVARKRAITFFA